MLDWPATVIPTPHYLCVTTKMCVAVLKPHLKPLLADGLARHSFRTQGWYSDTNCARRGGIIRRFHIHSGDVEREMACGTVYPSAWTNDRIVVDIVCVGAWIAGSLWQNEKVSLNSTNRRDWI